jgi:UDPglucose 6-dehydrogenase
VGYGGSCFPKDVKALLRTGAEHGYKLHVLDAVERANDLQKHVLVEKIRKRFGSKLSGMKIALWGLAFKANTDDMREAASRTVIEDLWNSGATLCAYDPVAMPEGQRLYGKDARISWAQSPMGALEGADALAIVTEWKEFRSPDFAEIRKRLRHPVIFDGRNLYEPPMVREAGLEYYPIGRL